MAKSVFQILIDLEGDAKAKAALQDVGTQIGLAGAALTAFTALSAKAAQDFEYNMAKVSTLATDATGSSADFSKAIFELSSELGGAVSVTEAAGASYEMLSSGFSEQADILGILKTSQMAAIGGYSDLGTVSEATAKLLNVYGDSLGENLSITEKAQIITDQMIQTQNLGAITVDQYARLIGNVASSAKASGVSLEELNAVVALNTSKGQRASSVIDVLKTAMAAFARPTAAARETAKELGIQFDSTALQAKGLEQIVQELAASGADMADLTNLFGSAEAANVMIALVDNAKQYSEAVKGMHQANGMTQESFKTMAETAQVSLQALQNNFQNALVGLGTNTLIALTPAIESLNQLVMRFNELDNETKGAIGSVVAITGGFLTLVGATGLFLSGAGAVISSFSTVGGLAVAGTKGIAGMAGSLTSLTVTLAKTSIDSAQLAKNIASFTVEMVKSAKAGLTMANVTKTFQGLQLGLQGATSAMWASRAAMLQLSAVAGGVAAAIWLASKAIEHYQNIQTEEKNTQLLSDLQQTQKLADEATRLGIQIKQSGKSLPKEEYEAWLKLLQEANVAHGGTLDGIIKAFQNTQQEAVKSEGERAKLTKAQALANEEAGKSEEDRKQKLDDFLESQNRAIQLGNKRLELEKERIEATSGSEEETIQRTLEAEQKAAAERIRINQETLANQELDAQKREEIELDIQGEILKMEQATVDAQERLRELQFKRLETRATQELAMAESVARQRGDTELEVLESTQDEYDRVMQVRRDALNAELQGLSANSAERAEVESKIADLAIEQQNRIMQVEKLRQEAYLDGFEEREIRTKSELDLATRNAELQRLTELQSLQATQEAFEENQEARRQSIEVQLELTREGTTERAKLESELASLIIEGAERAMEIEKARLEQNLEGLEVERTAREAMLSAMETSLSNFSTYQSGTESYLGSVQSSLGRIGQLLRDECLTIETRNRLNQVGQGILNSLREMGIDIQQQGSLEATLKRASLDIDQAKLQVQDQILAAKSEELKMEAQINALKQQAIVQENQLKLESGTLTENEARQSQLAIQIAQQNLRLEEQRLQVGLRGIELQRQANQLNQSINQAQGARGFTQPPQQMNLQPLVQPLVQPIQAAQEKTSQALTTLTTATNQASAKTIQSQAQANATLSQSVQANRQSVQALMSISSKMDRLIASVNSLPGAIAARIPRPAPSR